MGRLADLSPSPFIKEYSQGAAQSALQPVADFLAPTVNVSHAIGHFKVYTEKNRFHVPDTKRAINGPATRVFFDASDATYNCQPHAIDAPIDMLEEQESEGTEDMFREAADMAAEIGALAHEKTVIDTAVAALTGGAAAVVFNGTNDPVSIINTWLLSTMKNTRTGSAMGMRLLFGATAWNIFMTDPKVAGKFIIGTGKGRGAEALNIANVETASQLFLGQPRIMVSYAVQDTAAEGVTASYSFLFDSSIIVFAALDSPTRRDPSFMKTFRLNGQWMVPGTYEREDGRGRVAKFDWCEDVKVTNTVGGKLLTVTTS